MKDNRELLEAMLICRKHFHSLYIEACENYDEPEKAWMPVEAMNKEIRRIEKEPGIEIVVEVRQPEMSEDVIIVWRGDDENVCVGDTIFIEGRSGGEFAFVEGVSKKRVEISDDEWNAGKQYDAYPLAEDYDLEKIRGVA